MNYMNLWYGLKAELLKDKEKNADLIIKMGEMEVQASLPEVRMKNSADLAVYEACKQAGDRPR